MLQAQQVQQRPIAADGYELYGLNHPLVSMLIQVTQTFAQLAAAAARACSLNVPASCLE
jgi:hypothetical protein